MAQLDQICYPRLDRCLVLAAQWHSGTEREGANPLPYLTHPVEVLINLRYIGGVTDEDLLCAAVLHDVIEETSATQDDIERSAGSKVRSLVNELTRREPTEVERAGLTKEQVWELRSTMLIEEIRKMSTDAQQVKLADRLSNLKEGIRTKNSKKLSRYIDQTKTILKVIPEDVNTGLWNAIQKELK